MTKTLLSPTISKRNRIGMIRKLIASASILSLLVSVLAGTLLIQNGAITFGAQEQTSNSDTIVNGSQVANITVQSPENMTYYGNNVTLAFTIECDVLPRENVSANLNTYSAFSGNISFFTYGVVLDYNPSELLNLILNYASNGETVHETPDNVSTSFSSLGNNFYAGNTTLTDLTQGTHNVTIWVSVYHWIISDFLGTPYPNYEGGGFVNSFVHDITISNSNPCHSGAILAGNCVVASFRVLCCCHR